MKKILFILACLSFSAPLLSQNMMNCCARPANTEFAELGNDKNFIMSHTDPLPFIYSSDHGKPIIFTAADGTEAYGWEIRSKTPTHNYLFVIHEWWGLNDYIKKQSEQFWTDLGINVIALDLYDKKIATTANEAGKYMQDIKPERAEAIIRGALAYVGKEARVFTVGWCFGGGWSLQASLLAGSQAAGCIIYYGMPEKDPGRIQTLQADVLGIFANKDQWISPKIVDEFKANMEKAGKKIYLHRYDADHAFANPSNPKHDVSATAEAYQYSLDFIKQRIQ